MPQLFSHQVLALALLLATSATLRANEGNDTLEQEIRAADQRFFHAFNRCDVDTMGSIFAQELEFYHDTGGVSDYEGTMRVTRENCQRELGLVRTLLRGTDKIYPVKDFGAIHQGEHTFCHLDNGQQDCGTFGFTHVWRRRAGGWQVYRVISYGH